MFAKIPAVEYSITKSELFKINPVFINPTEVVYVQERNNKAGNVNWTYIKLQQGGVSTTLSPVEVVEKFESCGATKESTR